MLAFDARRNEAKTMNSEIPQISNCIKFSFQQKNVDSTCCDSHSICVDSRVQFVASQTAVSRFANTQSCRFIKTFGIIWQCSFSFFGEIKTIPVSFRDVIFVNFVRQRGVLPLFVFTRVGQVWYSNLVSSYYPIFQSVFNCGLPEPTASVDSPPLYFVIYDIFIKALLSPCGVF